MCAEKIQYEFDSSPEVGHTMPVIDGMLWLRMPLPFALSHINLWLLQDHGGWAIVDTGVATDVSKKVWQRTFTDSMAGEPVTRVIATHMHPDHVGCAGWLTEKFDVELWMTREEYMLCRVLVADTGRPAPEAGLHFYAAAGFPPESLEQYRKIFGFFGKFVSPLPDSYERMSEGDRLSIGERSWEILIGCGHSPEHACLYNNDLNVLISGDQLLPTISANVGVYPTEPHANPLKDWLESLAALKEQVTEDVLVLPAHGKPFRGTHMRLDALISEHMLKLEKLHDFCREPRRAIDTFPALYKREITPDHLIMATGEAIAHLHYLIDTNTMVADADNNDVFWYRSN